MGQAAVWTTYELLGHPSLLTSRVMQQKCCANGPIFGQAGTWLIHARCTTPNTSKKTSTGLGTAAALQVRVNIILVLGLGILAGQLSFVAPSEVLVTSAFAAPIVALVLRVKPARVARLSLLYIGIASVSLWRTSHVVAQHETLRESTLPDVAVGRCAGVAKVLSSPIRVASDRDDLRWLADLEVTECEGVASQWRGLATLYGGPQDVARGDRLEVVVQLGPAERFWNAELGDPRPGDARRKTLRSGGVLAFDSLSTG